MVENEPEKIANATGLDVTKIQALQASAKEWLASEESQSVSQAQIDENLQDQPEIVEQETGLEDNQEQLDQA